MTEALGRMAQIHATLASLAPTRTTSTAAVGSGSSGTSSSTSTNSPAFQAALAKALAAGAVSSSSASTGLDASAVPGLSTYSGLSSITDPATAAASALASASSVDAVSGAATVGTAAGGVTGTDVVDAAKKYVGVPYVWGGTDPAVGMDCSGFVQRVFKDVGIQLPRLVRDQMTHGTPVASLKDAKPGDLLISFGGDHIAIYVGDGKAIDAPVPGKTIQVRDAWEKYSNLTAIRRIVPDSTSSSATSALIGPTGTALTGTGSTVGVAAASAPVTVGATSVPLTASQKQYAQQIVNRVKERGLPQRAAEIALATAMQESNLRMYWNPKVPGSQALAPDQSAQGVDGYSVGLFQQQVNGSMFSWGTVSDAMNPTRSTDMFLDRLQTIPGWQQLPLTVAAQRVQVSAYPDAYAKWESQARQLAQDLSVVAR
ncbi:C40 family peptidase [Tersicoccus sp. MR15.9]|uniref:C40 family peptidase n=1 Tax=Tersicoccus mangrovi TaxID=3121635 RepID=UPI002FE5C00F